MYASLECYFWNLQRENNDSDDWTDWVDDDKFLDVWINIFSWEKICDEVTFSRVATNE